MARTCLVASGACAGTFLYGRGHPARSGTGLRSPTASNAPTRKDTHPAARNVPTREGGPTGIRLTRPRRPPRAPDSGHDSGLLIRSILSVLGLIVRAVRLRSGRLAGVDLLLLQCLLQALPFDVDDREQPVQPYR